MTLTTWRIVKRKYATTAFSGQGAMLYPGRWNETGVRMVYTSATRSLAMLEMLAHLGVDDFLAPYVVFPVTIPTAHVWTPATLPRGWRNEPPGAASQRFGTRWVEQGTTVALQVPSVIVPGEYNYLLNPLHPRFADVGIGKRQPLVFDSRLKGLT